MPTHPTKLTDSEARKIAPPENGYAMHWCPKTPGFGLRVTAQDARAWISERRVEGKTKRRTLGPASGRGAISRDAATRLQIEVSSELQQGVDRVAIKRERAATERAQSVTVADALRDYVKTKRRKKDGLPLKARTQADYLAMLAPPRMKVGAKRKRTPEAIELSGEQRPPAPPTQAGELYALADVSIHKISADLIRDTHNALAERGERRQTYAMQVLRALLRHHGVNIDGNPLSTATAGKDRVSLAPSRGKPSPIPSERLGAWWRAACAIDTPSAHMLRFELLTGLRPGEAAGALFERFDPEGARLTLMDTKNRTDHVIFLSSQALLIATSAAKGKKNGQALFGIVDAGKTLDTINALAGVTGISQHKLRHTFASVAAEIVPAFALRRMLNHAAAGDVTAGHYVHSSEKMLRTAWQNVADYIAAAE